MRRRRSIFIELTSLLDVILIMLFLILTQARAQADQAREEALREKSNAAAYEASLETEAAKSSKLAAELEAAEEETERLKRQLESREIVLENSRVITLSITGENHIRLETDKGATHLVPYEWGNESYAYNLGRSLLLSQLEEEVEKPLFVIFQYDRDQIYKAEYDMILQLIQEMKLEAGQRERMLSFVEMDRKE